LQREYWFFIGNSCTGVDDKGLISLAEGMKKLKCLEEMSLNFDK